MTMPVPVLPYGLRDVKVYTLDAAGVKGTAVDLPNARHLTFEEAEDFNDLRGDDHLVTKRGNGPTVNWELEAGGISLEALVVINGGAITSTGTGPTAKKTYSKKSTDARPHFAAEGQSISDNGGDLHVVLHNLLADGGVSGEFTDGDFFLTTCSGTGFASLATADNGLVYEFVNNATATAVV